MKERSLRWQFQNNNGIVDLPPHMRYSAGYITFVGGRFVWNEVQIQYPEFWVILEYTFVHVATIGNGFVFE